VGEVTECSKYLLLIYQSELSMVPSLHNDCFCNAIVLILLIFKDLLKEIYCMNSRELGQLLLFIAFPKIYRKAPIEFKSNLKIFLRVLRKHENKTFKIINYQAKRVTFTTLKTSKHSFLCM